MDAMDGAEPKIILYDGVCTLCDGAVRFILPRDSRGLFRFASLQSDFAKARLARHSISDLQALDSLLLLEGDRLSANSTGILRIALHLGFPWNLAGVFLGVPRPIRDAVYRWIARNRYRWFGKQESCLLPRPEWRHRFLG